MCDSTKQFKSVDSHKFSHCALTMFVVNASGTTLENRCLVVRIYHSAQQWRVTLIIKAAGMDVLQ